MEKAHKAVKVMFIIFDVILLPCAVSTIDILIYLMGGDIFISYFIPALLTIPIVFMRCFGYLPYILAFLLAASNFFLLIKNKFPQKDIVTFVILFAVCVVGLFSVEDTFWAAMSV